MLTSNNVADIVSPAYLGGPSWVVFMLQLWLKYVQYDELYAVNMIGIEVGLWECATPFTKKSSSHLYGTLKCMAYTVYI